MGVYWLSIHSAAAARLHGGGATGGQGKSPTCVRGSSMWYLNGWGHSGGEAWRWNPTGARLCGAWGNRRGARNTLRHGCSQVRRTVCACIIHDIGYLAQTRLHPLPAHMDAVPDEFLPRCPLTGPALPRPMYPAPPRPTPRRSLHAHERPPPDMPPAPVDPNQLPARVP